jgi:CheY-like chemotaxis protein
MLKAAKVHKYRLGACPLLNGVSIQPIKRISMSAPKILVVDDNPVVVKAVNMKLAAAGFAVLTARDGSEAIGLVRRERPDLIVLDISFPPDVGGGGTGAWDGFQIMQWLHRMDEAKNTPVVIITGQDPSKYRDQAIKLGAAAFFAKPVDNDALIKTIRGELSKGADPASGTNQS